MLIVFSRLPSHQQQPNLNWLPICAPEQRNNALIYVPLQRWTNEFQKRKSLGDNFSKTVYFVRIKESTIDVNNRIEYRPVNIEIVWMFVYLNVYVCEQWKGREAKKKKSIHSFDGI